MIITPTLSESQSGNTSEASSSSLAHSISQRTIDLLWGQEQEKTPLSEGYIEPLAAIEPILWEIQDETGAIPYSFETTKMNSPGMGTPTWFRFHGLNKAGKWFILSGSIAWDAVNVQHILAEGFGQQVRPALENHLASIGIKTCYATFTRANTARSFLKYSWYAQVTPEDVPPESWKGLSIVESDVTRTLYNPATIVDDFHQDKQLLLRKVISI